MHNFRSIYLRYDKSVINGLIPSYRYLIPSAVYNPFLPENKGFCSDETPQYFDSDIQPRQYYSCKLKFFI